MPNESDNHESLASDETVGGPVGKSVTPPSRPEAKVEEPVKEPTPASNGLNPRDHHNVEVGVTASAPLLSFDEIVAEVLDGQWSDGEERKGRLRAAGYSYIKVEAEVQRQLQSKE
jgi:hypothetical protein